MASVHEKMKNPTIRNQIIDMNHYNFCYTGKHQVNVHAYLIL